MKVLLVAALLAPSAAFADSQVDGSQASGAHPGDSQIGASLGVAQTNASVGDVIGLFGRHMLTGELAAEVGFGYVDQSTICFSSCLLDHAVTGSANIVRDLAHGRVVPLVRAGVGLDYVWADTMGTVEWTFAHAELGVGLEYRAAGGWILGANIGAGWRSLIQHEQNTPYFVVLPQPWNDGLYATAGVTVAKRL
jgi:hypothetical protein